MRRKAAAIHLFEGPAAGLPAGARSVEGSRAADGPGLLAAVAEALDFPGYYGGTWDALDECLSDLRWIPGRAVLVFRDAGRVLEKAPARRAILLRILHAAGTGSGLRTFLQDRPGALGAWRDLCEAQGIPFTVPEPGTPRDGQDSR